MARYNSSLASTTITGTHTISSPNQGAFTNLAGTAPYTVTLPSPVLFPGSNQTFYNATGGTVTLSTPSGILTGTGGSNASTVPCFAGNVLSVTSDGTNYVVISEDGSALVATTGSFSGDVTMNGAGATVALTPQTVTITPSSTSNINNMNIGATTRGSGAFTSLAANAAVTFTANTSSTTTGSGTLVVTGGVGVSGQVTATTLSATNIYGTVQTAAQPNITSTGSLAVPSLVVNGAVSRQILTALTSSALMDANTTNNMLTLNAPYSGSPASNTNGGNSTNAKWGIHFVGKTESNDLDSLGKSASIYAISEDTFGYNRQVGLALFTSSFDANQAERVRIDNTGQVRIGSPITTASTILTISKPIDSEAYGSGTRMIDFKSYFPGYDVNTVKASIYAGVSARNTLNTQGGYLAFYTSNDGTNAERMRIEKDGAVGIGTTDFSAGYTFNVAKRARFNGMMLGNGDGSNAADNRIGLDWASGSYAQIVAQQNVPLYLGVGGATKVALDSGGHWLPLTNDTQNLGSTSAAWANIYTNDLHLNNETKVNGNDVDGTTGNWTIQEGAENLYIINNKTGKKFAFVLKELE
jgi:hypothetical protein